MGDVIQLKKDCEHKGALPIAFETIMVSPAGPVVSMKPEPPRFLQIIRRVYCYECKQSVEMRFKGEEAV